MMIPNFIDVKVIDVSTGKFTAEWGVIMQQLFTQLQKNASDQGLVVGSQNQKHMIDIQDAVTKAPPNTPPTLPMADIPISVPGTLLFNTSTPNGGTIPNPFGQLWIKLQDGLFHPITNT